MREQPDQYEHAADQLNPGPSPPQNIVRSMAAKHHKNFAGAMAGKEETKHDAKRSVRGGFKLFESAHSGPQLWAEIQATIIATRLWTNGLVRQIRRTNTSRSALSLRITLYHRTLPPSIVISAR